MDINFALPHINKLQPYVPGKPIETLAREKNLSRIIKLASNENPFGASPNVLNSIKNNLDSINLYPDPDQFELKQKLSEFYNIKPEMLAIGNGSDELLQLIMHAFVSSSNNIISPKYSFISYKVCSATIGAEYVESEVQKNWLNNLDNILSLINNNTKLICIANPNNPTGSYLDITTISNFLEKVPSNILVLLDEAYYEYIKYDSFVDDNYIDKSIELTKKYPNLIITRTFSKAYGLAGLRAGYSIANEYITKVINKIKQPFNVNRMVQFAACAAINDQDFISKVVEINNLEKFKLYSCFDKLNIEYIPSSTNFVTIKLSSADSSMKLYEYLLNNGIITRPINNYNLHEFLRISIGAPEENDEFINVLKTYGR